MRRMRFILFASLFCGGCVSTATTIVKAPFQVAGKAVDWTTTSQDEADRNYGRKMRKQEERDGRRRREAAERCRKHPDDRSACDIAQGYSPPVDY